MSSDKAQRHWDKAKEYLQHYFRTVFNKAGLHFDGDNETEVYEIVDEIMEAVRAELSDRDSQRRT